MNTYEIKDVIKVLREGRDLLVKHGHTKHALARDAKGRKVDACSNEAVCFCTEGAVVRAAHGVSLGLSWVIPKVARDALDFLSHSMASDSVVKANDRRSTTPEQVVTAFNFAIEFAKDDLKQAKKGGKK